MSRKKLGEILIDAGLLSQRQLEHALHEQRRWGGQLGKLLVEQGFVSEELLARALGKQLCIPIVTLEGVEISDSVLDMVEQSMAEQHVLIPFHSQSRFLDVAMADPMNMGIIDELRIRTRLNVRPHIAARSEIIDAIRRSYRRHDPAAVDVDFSEEDFAPKKSDNLSDMRDAEIASLQKRMAAMEALVKRDEDVIRKLLALLVRKNVATREEILEAIK